MPPLFSYKTYIASFAASLALTFLVTPWVIRLATAWDIVDRPGQRKRHQRAVPLMGGLGVFGGMWTPIFLLLWWWPNAVSAQLAQAWPPLLAIFLAGGVMLALGAVDDKKGLGARVKLSVQIPVALALGASGLSFDALSVPVFGTLHLGVWGLGLAVFWMVGVTNALNLIDGIDGLAAGVALFVAFTNGLLAIAHNNVLLACVMFSMAGACLGFLHYNSQPARIFLGDSGSLFLGVTLGVAAIASNHKGSLTASLLAPLLVLGYPVADTLLAMARRLLCGRSMFSADRGHIHHRLLAKGFSHKQAAWVGYGLCALLSFTALSMVLRNDSATLLGILVCAGLLGWGLKSLGYIEHFSSKRLHAERTLFRSAHHLAEWVKAKAPGMKNRRELLDLLRVPCGEFAFEALEIFVPSGAAEECQVWVWRRGAARFEYASGRPRSIETQRWKRDRLAYPETGLRVHAYYQEGRLPEEVMLEYRLLLHDIFQAVNDRLRVIPAEPALAARVQTV